MECALCKKDKKTLKKNTHYLTDSIIRTCLNKDGSNEREEGFYFNISNNTPFVDFNFQRETSIEVLEESLGRQASDDEIEKAKRIPFSVDNIFCSDCEEIFTQIETPFIENILPQFRQSDLTSVNQIELTNNKDAKLFFYLQVWRTAVCEEIFNLNEETLENLRLLILNFKATSNDNIPIFPIHISYLQTLGEEKSYTENFVGFSNDRNPNIIFMNDFVIQFFDNIYSIKQIDLYNLNSSNDLIKLINYDNEKFKVKILHNKEREKILDNINRKEKVEKTFSYFIQYFKQYWYLIFGVLPNDYLIQEYLKYITEGGFDVLKYTKESIVSKTTEFIKEKQNNKR